MMAEWMDADAALIIMKGCNKAHVIYFEKIVSNDVSSVRSLLAHKWRGRTI